MSERKKNLPRNTLKEKEDIDDSFDDVNLSKPEADKLLEQTKDKTVKPKKKKDISLKEKLDVYFSFVQNEKFRKITGLLLLLFSVYFFIAFVSYLFTWQTDQDKVWRGWGNLLMSDVKVDNWLGKLGALLSHSLIHRWMGVSSFILSFLSFLYALHLAFNAKPFNLAKVTGYSIFALLWSSIVLGYFLGDSYFYLGGGFGYVVSNWLNLLIGNFGTGILLFFSLLGYLVLTFNIPLWPKQVEDVKADIPSQPTSAVVQEPVFEIKETQKNILKEDVPSVVDFSVEDESQKKTPDVSEESSNTIDLDAVNTAEPIIETIENGVEFTVEKIAEEQSSDSTTASEEQPFGDYDPTLDLSSYQFPTIDLLEDHSQGKEVTVNTEELTSNKNRIVETLGNYGIQIEKIKATIGPTVTLYEIIPAAGVRISKIKNLEDDIALSLSALGIRIIAPIPGKGTIGIEVPNLNPETVPMKNIISSEKFQNTGMDLPIALGKTISNETFIADLAKMPHLLMAGATGQGKSVGLNAILVSLLYKKHPSQIKFVLVDPKKVELTLFNKIERHFLAKLPDSEEAIITDTKKVINTLNSLCIEMDQRYDLLKDAQVRNLKEYNAKFISRKLNPNKGHRYLPYIILVVDEFADLIMTAGKEVETPIARLAQLARAIGIHLIIATQRPSVNIITGTIKANFPARIAFRVTSKIDSRTILDAGGADQLIGRGDMLLSTGNDLTRIQCAFVDTTEVEKITDFIGSQRSYPEAFKLPEYVGEDETGGKEDIDPSERDSLFDEAAHIIVQHQQGSASLLQRRLKLGYNRAGRIVDQLEAAGIIGPFEGSKAREVLIKDVLTLEQFLKGTSNKDQII
ncbi:MAG: DNA translocase FtsK 4TM domain-containing protein [Bacteroidetes bacterium]|nr:DNA translocase FtsK 4TM domain-containing protein [Bacteroidota bacterium]